MKLYRSCSHTPAYCYCLLSSRIGLFLGFPPVRPLPDAAICPCSSSGMVSDLEHGYVQLSRAVAILLQLVACCRSISVTASLCSGAFDTRNTTRHSISLPVPARSHNTALCLQYVSCPRKAMLEHISKPVDHKCTSLALQSVVTVSKPHSLSALRLETNNKANE